MSLINEGYVYVSSEDTGVMSHARPGVKISLHDRRAPWIVVDQSINSIVVARWPGKLWRVAIADSAGIEQASAHARYTRAFEVTVLEEIPLSQLFGEQGEAVCSVIDAAIRLELSQVNRLASGRHQEASDAYSRTWNNWLAAVGGTQVYRDVDLTGTIGISAAGAQSPINYGLSVLHQAISKRAEKLVGSSAFIIDQDGEKFLEPTWSSASNALLEAALAFGTTFATEADKKIMSEAWCAVFGEPC